jgi:pilus assembly protein TadC
MAMTVAFEGWWRGALSGLWRGALLLSALGLFVPAIEINLAAGLALGVLGAWRHRRSPTP